MILSIDPGSLKCGLAVLDRENVYFKEIIKIDQGASRIVELIKEYSISEIVVGKGTGSQNFLEQVKNISIPIKVVDEKNTTLDARKLYWQDNRPMGLLNIIPRTLLFPPRPIDDYAAVVIGRRYLEVFH